MCGYNFMSQSSESSGAKRRDRSKSEEKPRASKLFITNLDGKVFCGLCKSDTKEVEDELRRMFEKYGTVDNIVAKRNRNSEYCFAFVEMKDQASAQECVKAYFQKRLRYDNSYIGGKQIKVEFQDDTKRRKDSKYNDKSFSKGCYNCGKMGHFARECHSNRAQSGRGRRYSRSASEDSYRRKKHSKRRRSDSSDRGHSRSKSKKERKHRSRDRDEKRKKRHKRSRSES